MHRLPRPLRRLTVAALVCVGCAAALEPEEKDGSAGSGGELQGVTGNTEPPMGGLVSPPTEEGGQLDAAQPPPPAGEFAAAAFELCRVVNAYRVSRGLPEIPLSQALMRTANAHIGDLNRHPEVAVAPCNLHSWSNEGPWTPCCYTSDHAQAQCMWDKPREIGRNGYNGDGFEIAAQGGIDPAQALALWQQSGPHHEVILNAGTWQGTSPWPAMGCGLGGKYAVAWFGSEPDPLPP